MGLLQFDGGGLASGYVDGDAVDAVVAGRQAVETEIPLWVGKGQMGLGADQRDRGSSVHDPVHRTGGGQFERDFCRRVAREIHYRIVGEEAAVTQFRGGDAEAAGGQVFYDLFLAGGDVCCVGEEDRPGIERFDPDRRAGQPGGMGARNVTETNRLGPSARSMPLRSWPETSTCRRP